jgi:hypothetical protein
MVDSKRDELTASEEERYLKLHQETQTALQIVLAIGAFETGDYEADEYCQNWHKCLGQIIRINKNRSIK